MIVMSRKTLLCGVGLLCYACGSDATEPAGMIDVAAPWVAVVTTEWPGLGAAAGATVDSALAVIVDRVVPAVR